MKILYINWAPLWAGAQIGGGVNLYSQSMATNLVKHGHELYSLSSGFAYNCKTRVYIAKSLDYMGVKNYEVFNAPNIAPGFFNYENPLRDISEPVVEKIFEQFIKTLKPDIVHFHNIEGFSANCISIVRKNNIRVIYSLHNYHLICNQVNLMYKGKQICSNFEDGKKCLNCISPPGYSQEILKRKIAYHFTKLPYGAGIWYRGGAITRLLIKDLNLSKKNIAVFKHLRPSQNAKNEYTNRHLLYAERRKRIIKALNNAHLIHAVSTFVKDFYIKQGIKKDIITTCHIGNKMADYALKQPVTSTRSCNSKQVKIVFLGVSSHEKGLPFLIDTLLGMDNSILKQINLNLYALGIHNLNNSLKLLSNKLYSLNTFNGYDFNDLPKILSDMNYGIVPPLWYDNAPQVVFEMLAMKVPVIGAKIGGIPDFVKHMENGLLFQSGNMKELSAQIKTAVMERDLENRLRKNITPMKTPDQHAKELERYYRTV